MVVEVTNTNFDELLNSGKPMVLDFWAEWCGPCRMIGPIIDALAEEYADKVTIGKVNVDNDEHLASRFEIRSIPTVIFFKDGKIAEKVVGGAQRHFFVERIESLLS